MKRIIISPPFGSYLPFPWATRVIGTHTASPRSGSKILQAIKTLRPIKGGWVNNIGLINEGVGHYNYRNVYDDPKKIYSFAVTEDTPEYQDQEWKFIGGIIPDGKIIELNASCPNVKEAQPSELIISLFKMKSNILIVKLPPHDVTALEMVERAIDVDVTYFHCCNTLPSERGGKSGRVLSYYSLHIIDVIKHRYPDVTIIGGGGIYTPKDVDDYYNAGAEYFSLATIFLTPWKVPAVVKQVRKHFPR